MSASPSSACHGSASSRSAPDVERRAAETRRAYLGDWSAFLRWCAARQISALPADGRAVADYLAACAAAGSAGAASRKVSAIAAFHRDHGFPPPGRHAAVRAWLKDHRRRSAGDVPFSKLVGERSRHPPSPAALLRAAGLCPGDMAGLRDRCLLALSANGVPDPALIALDAEQLRSSHGGYELRLTNPDRTVPILPVGAAAAASSVCPVRALQDWLSASDCLFGPVFRKVDRWGNAEYRRLSAGGLRCIWRRRLGNARRRYGKASLA